MDDICSICHESMDDDLYTLPECSHIFHTNCIMTWWRTGQNTCPLCNNAGVNASALSEVGGFVGDWSTIWFQRMENYKKLRLYSRKKNAPASLKKMIQKIKKIEERKKFHGNDFKKWRTTISENKTNGAIIKEWRRRNRIKWKFNTRLRSAKLAVGASEKIVPIIIATKIDIH